MNRTLLIAITFAVLWSTAVKVDADQVIERGRNRVNVDIVGVKGGKLRFTTRSGRLHEVWLDEVSLILVDRGGLFADFNEGERLSAGGEPTRAVARYRRALALAEEFWPELVAARLARACSAAGMLDRAVANWILVVRGKFTGPPAATRMFPTSDAPVAHHVVVRAVELLEGALRSGIPENHRTLLNAALYEVIRPGGGDRMHSMAELVAGQPIDPAIRSPMIYAIQARAMADGLDQPPFSGGSLALEDAIAYSPAETLPAFLLLKGHRLMSQADSPEQIIRATWLYMRVAIHFPDDQRAVDGLYHTAMAMDRMGRPGKAKMLLTESLRHEKISDVMRKTVRSAMENLNVP